MTERVYWKWFAMRTDEKKNLAVVVAERLNDQWVPQEWQIDSDPISMEEAEAQAVEKNLGAIRRGEHIICSEDWQRTPKDAVTSELRELHVRLEALEQRLEKWEQNEQRRHDETLFTLRSLVDYNNLSQRLARLEERVLAKPPDQ